MFFSFFFRLYLDADLEDSVVLYGINGHLEVVIGEEIVLLRNGGVRRWGPLEPCLRGLLHMER